MESDELYLLLYQIKLNIEDIETHLSDLYDLSIRAEDMYKDKEKGGQP